jgi:uncharacterized membrane protein YkvA (DUF1232 family)
MPKLARKAAFAAIMTVLRGVRGGPSLGQRLSALPRMIGATLFGRYDGKGRLFAMVLAAAYILSPLDLIPEGLLGPFGLVDDSFVAVWLAGAVLAETERFLTWERRRTQVVDGQVTGR